jgi:DNA polymerase-3 subunit delta'
MSFAAIWGQDPAIQTLTRALRSERVHHAYRFEGPAGVGKTMAAMRMAQALVCERGEVGCEQCSACRRALTLTEDEPRVPVHPDVVRVGRGLYRSVTGQSEASGISVEQVRRVVLGRIGFSPHEGRALVFVIEEADELTPQAANSLLKTLEEPPARTHFLLLTSRPNRLLDTIRSRTLPVRFGPLSVEVIARILAARGLATDVAPFAEGSAELALTLADQDSLRQREQFASELDVAVAARDLAAGIRFADAQKGDRETLKAELGFFAQRLAVAARAAVGTAPEQALASARRHQAVLSAIQDVERNVQPALALEAMIQRIRQL